MMVKVCNSIPGMFTDAKWPRILHEILQYTKGYNWATEIIFAWPAGNNITGDWTRDITKVYEIVRSLRAGHYDQKLMPDDPMSGYAQRELRGATFTKLKERRFGKSK